MLTPQAIRRAIDPLPRVHLAHLPTPLEEAARFSTAIGGHTRIFIKRDDCTGLLLGGNKARHNEFLLGDAMSQGCDVVVWGAGVQSNNCRQTAAACARLGLDCHLYLSGSPPDVPNGNLLLDYLVGARVSFTTAPLGPELDRLLAEKADELKQAGRKPYYWYRPRVVPLAAVSYVLCVVEIIEQLRELGLEAATIYVSSSGGTGAGVTLAKYCLGLKTAVRCICPMPWPWSIPEALAHDANNVADMLGFPTRLTADDVDADENFIAPGYGLPSPAGHEAMRLMAKTEGVLVDPVYSAKALAGLISDVRAEKYPRNSVIVFIHTGGVPAIFGNPQSVQPL